MGTACSDQPRLVNVSQQMDVMDFSEGAPRPFAWSKADFEQEAVHTGTPADLDTHETFWESLKSNFSVDFALEPDDYLAFFVVRQCKTMAEVVFKEEEDCLDKDWPGPLGQDPLQVIFGESENAEIAQFIVELAESAQRCFMRERNVILAQVPSKVYGDTHGQFRDLLLLLGSFGWPHNHGQQFIFNGDFVDRGAHQLEVVCLLFALKLTYPTTVFMLRGNHEDPVQNMHMGPVGFLGHCHTRLGQKLGEQVFDAISRAFEWLPIACLIGDRILVVHGGIGDGQWDLEHLEDVTRPLSHDALCDDPILYNCLWSDPIPEDIADQQSRFGAHTSPRDNHENIIKRFGEDITEKFLRRNELAMVIRSHEARHQGYGHEVFHHGLCIRVFSARDYEGHQNDGSILSVRPADCSGLYLVRAQVLKSMFRAGEVATRATRCSSRCQ